MQNKSNRIGTTVVVAVLIMGLWAGILYARSGGISGTCAEPDGCSCHGDLPNDGGAVTVDISGPQIVDYGTTASYTITVTGDPSGTTGGFNLCADMGTLVPGTGTELRSGELTHSDGDSRSWTFDWTAPGAEGTANFTAAGLGSNGSGTGGDFWNWYGDTQGAPFAITVNGPVPALPTTWGMIKALYR